MSIERYLKSKGYDVSNEEGDIVVDFNGFKVGLNNLDDTLKSFNPLEYNFMKHGRNQIEAYRIRDNLRKLSEDVKRKDDRVRDKRSMLERFFREYDLMNHADWEQKEKIFKAAETKTVYNIATMIWICSDTDFDSVLNGLKERW